MSIAALVLLTILTGSIHANSEVWLSGEARQQSYSTAAETSQIKISLATGGGLFGPAKERFQVGERVPVIITMTNTGSEPVYVCNSDSIYQDRPRLLRDGKPLAYVSFTQWVMQSAEENKTCDKLNLPKQVLLRPNQPTVVDWFILSEGATSLSDNAWYEPLPAGNYTLSNQRRLSCCDGPLVETNSIEFVVVE